MARVQGDSEDDQTGQTKFVNPTDNRAAVRKSGLEFCAMLAETGTHYYSANSIELNTACRSHYRVASLMQGILIFLEVCENRLEKGNPGNFSLLTCQNLGWGWGTQPTAN